MTLPDEALFGKENYAGDELVRAFMDDVKGQFDLDFEVYVSWQCLPDVTVLRSGNGKSIVIRSERLDTLLIEYLKLYNDLIRSLQPEYAMASIYRWMAEYFVGLRQPHHALSALLKCHDVSAEKAEVIPFRDETLASVQDMVRCAVQCFSLAHEVGHIIWPVNEPPTLLDPVDGIAPLRHLSRDFEEGGFSGDLGLTVDDVAEKIGAAQLFSELNADFFAFESVFQFLYNNFDCEMSGAVKMSLLAAQGQYFMDSLRAFATTIVKCGNTQQEVDRVLQEDFVVNSQTSIRARCLLRRAGISWAAVECQTSKPSVDVINEYVPKIDRMVIEGFEVRRLLHSCSTRCGFTVMSEIQKERKNSTSEDAINQKLAILEDDRSLSMDMYYLLIAYGCSGAVRPDAYLRSLSR